MSGSQRAFGATRLPVAVTSTFGTTFWIGVETAEDYLLHPVFLRFAMICLCVRALLDEGDDMRLLQGWQVAVLWLILALANVALVMACLALLRGLSWAGARRRIYTPFLFLPLVMAGEYVTQGVIGLFREGHAKPLEAALVDMTRDLLVLMMFDALHALYVAPQHPMARPVGAQAEEMPRAADAAEEVTPVPVQAEGIAIVDSAADPAPLPEPEIAQIGERRFALAELISVRTEDHYLNVVTRSGRSLLRAKLSEVAALHGGRHGVQINRSEWVAFAAIVAMRDEGNGQIVLDLINGDSATVARTRRLVFRQLYQVAMPGRA